MGALTDNQAVPVVVLIVTPFAPGKHGPQAQGGRPRQYQKASGEVCGGIRPPLSRPTTTVYIEN